MTTWGDLALLRPDLTAEGRRLLYQFGVGLAFLATVRRDGGPRTHPMCPLLTDDGMYAFIVPSPKCNDLLRDGRYAMHSFPCPDNEDAFYVTGRASLVEDAQLRATLGEQFVTERGGQFDVEHLADQRVFEFAIDTWLSTKTTGHGDPNPAHTIWHAPTSAQTHRSGQKTRSDPC